MRISMVSTKKFLLVIISLTLIVNLFLPLTVNAEEAPTKCKMRYEVTIGDKTCTANEEIELNDERAACCFINALYSVRDWLFYILLTVAAIFIIVAAYHFVTAAGDPEKIKTARNFVLYALIGVMVAFLSRGLVALVQLIAGFG